MRYRKKPVVIDAWLVPVPSRRESASQDYAAEIAERIIEEAGAADVAYVCLARSGAEGTYGGIEIQTLEGVMRANPGDWLIRGVKGEFYPCKPDIFDATYERVGEEG